MQRDERVFCIGEDIAIPGGWGGAFSVTYGLEREFPEARLRNTPISESAIVGAAIGAAIGGLRPVADVQYSDFIFCAMDQIVNQAAKLCYMSGGQVSIPMVLRMPVGATTRGAQHGQCPESHLFHVPGWKIACPAGPYDAKGLLKAAIRDDSPVLFLEHKLLYGVASRKEPRAPTVTEVVPKDDYTVPLGQARVWREGRDVTVLATLLMVHLALQAAHALAAEGIEAEVVDPRTLIPFDWATLERSLRKTGRLVVVHEDHLQGGWGAEIAATAHAEFPDLLKTPVVRVGSPFVPPPFAPCLENEFVPSAEKIERAVRRALGEGRG
jgi:pyruvate/2-oxoglutarate/acetoin dehydrogenase E1 component